eukprot:c10385_g1_i1 orf=252-524(-)
MATGWVHEIFSSNQTKSCQRLCTCNLLSKGNPMIYNMTGISALGSYIALKLYVRRSGNIADVLSYHSSRCPGHAFSGHLHMLPPKSNHSN